SLLERGERGVREPHVVEEREVRLRLGGLEAVRFLEDELLLLADVLRRPRREHDEVVAVSGDGARGADPVLRVPELADDADGLRLPGPLEGEDDLLRQGALERDLLRDGRLRADREARLPRRRNVDRV